MKYIHLPPSSELPILEILKPFRAVVVVEAIVNPSWQALVSKWLVTSGCLYMMAWGRDCSSWDDSVDFAILEMFDYGEIPDNNFVMTTWHEKDTLGDVFWFAKNNAFHADVEIMETLILHIAATKRGEQLTHEFERA